MKTLILLTSVFLLNLPAEKCSSKKNEGSLLKGKLEIQALCMNYTIRLVEGHLDTSMVAAKWTDETTGKSYTNAFGLANPCDFPSAIKEGDEFYFTIDTAKEKNCAVCMAYYPTPPKKLMIKVSPK
jgi:hypothetical protein